MSRRSRGAPGAPTAPSANDPHDIVYFKRHHDDDATESMPGRDVLESWPVPIRARIRAVLVAVAAAPPKRFAGGGYWEAMHGDMSGWFEIRVSGPPGRTHYRLFCLLDYKATGTQKPLLVVVDGRSKANATLLPSREYDAVRALGKEYLSRNPRSIG